MLNRNTRVVLDYLKMTINSQKLCSIRAFKLEQIYRVEVSRISYSITAIFETNRSISSLYKKHEFIRGFLQWCKQLRSRND